MASSSVAWVTDEKHAFANVIEYSYAFAEYFEPVKVLVTGSSIGKYAGLQGADLEGDLLSNPSAMMSRHKA
jgi:hypothetical protein